MEADGATPPKADCMAPLKDGWAGIGVGIEEATVEFPKMEELRKLGPRAGCGASCFCTYAAPNAGWGVAPRDSGKGGLEHDSNGIVNAEVELEILDDNAGWLVLTRAEAARGLPTVLKLAVLVVEDIWTALGRTWLKMVTVCTVGMVGRWHSGKVKPEAGEKLAVKAQAAPSGKGGQVEGMEQVLPMVLVTFTTPNPKGGLKEPLDVLAGVVDMTTVVALTRPWKRRVEAGVGGGEVCLKEKGALTGIVLSGLMLPKTGLKVGVEIPGGEDDAAVLEILEYEEPPISLLAGSPEMGFDMRSAEVATGGADAGRWGAGLPINPNKVLCIVGAAGIMAGESRGMAA